MYQTDINKQNITIEGKTFTASEIVKGKALRYDFMPTHYLELNRFLRDWFDKTDEMTIFTSGSTGKPKSLNVKKIHMMQSACITCGQFNLKPEDKTLLCMSLKFIAGKMMVVRALVAGLDLYSVEPSGHPLNQTNVNFQFASMVPLQVYNSLQISSEKERLKQTGTLLIGGGTLNGDLEKELNIFPNPVYVSYGMTETLSHIALRRINGPEASLNYTPLPSVSLSLSNDSTLIIDAPLVCGNTLFTNDVAEINYDGSFRILGRKDNVIITGGTKIQIETLEASIGNYIKTSFAISSLPDRKFGEIVVLAVEKTIDISLLSKYLSSYEIPKKIIRVKEIPHTESGKIDRLALKQMLQSL